MKQYCPVCKKVSETHTQTFPELLKVKGEDITINSTAMVCNECGERVFNYSLEEKNLELAYNIYRKKHNILTAEEIKKIREKYCISQRTLAELLDWGEVTINRYENGAIQDAVHNEVLMFIEEPKNMKKMFETNKEFLSPAKRDKLGLKIDELINAGCSNQNISEILEDFIYKSHTLDEFSGFTQFNLDKLTHEILYIAAELNGIFITKLNKLLWYIDFLNFKNYSVSITGCNYTHLPLGPVPEQYKMIIWATELAGLITETECTFLDGNSSIKYLPAIESKEAKKFFNENEFKIIDYILGYFKNFSGAEIVEKSHKEKAFLETQNQDKISYVRYSKDLSLECPV